jgi:hypothetical protein
MYCSNCGKEINNGGKFCNHCGAAMTVNAPAENASGNLCIVTVRRKKGYTGAVMSAKVNCNGREIGSLGNGETKDFQVAKGCVLVFKCSIGPGSETDPITINTDGKIQLEWTNTAKAVLLGPLTMLSKKHRQQFVAKLVTDFD